MKRFIQILKFHIERFLLGGIKNQLLLITVIIILLSTAAGLIVSLIYPEIKLLDAIWWAFLRLSDPGYLGDDKGLGKKIISTIITIAGYVLFLGSLVAIMTQWLNITIKKLESGYTPISLKGHILIIGWTNRTPIIIKELLLSEERVGKFLKRIKRRKLSIVIASQEVNTAKLYQLRGFLGKLWNSKQIILRTCNPLIINDLKRVDFLNAAVIIMPGSTYVYGSMEQSDLMIIKTLSSVSYQSQNESQNCPHFVTEMMDVQKISLIKQQYHGDLQIIASNILISRIIFQVLNNKGISSFFSEILTHEGSEIYLNYNIHSYKNFNSLKYGFEESIALGLLRRENNHFKVLLNPGGDIEITEDDAAIVIAENMTKSEQLAHPKDTAFKTNTISLPDSGKENTNILFIGWNNKLPEILKEMNNTSGVMFTVTIFSQKPLIEREEILQRYIYDNNRVSITHIKGNPTILSEFQKLNLSQFSKVVILASDWLPTGLDADTHTIMSYLIINEIIKKSETKPHITIELMDSDNSHIIKNPEVEIVVTPILISHTLAQVALKKELRLIYDELFSSKGPKVHIVSSTSYNLSDKTMSFREIEKAVCLYNNIALGIFTKNRETIINPPKDSEWYCDESISIISLQTE